MRRPLVLLLCTLLAAGCTASAGRRAVEAGVPQPAGAAQATDPTAAQKMVEDAKARAVAIPAQVDALVALAFPSTPSDPAVREAARNELVVFGEHAITPLAAAVPRVTPENRVHVVKTMMAAFRRLSYGLPPDYLPGIEAGIWFGDHATRELAIPELARFRQRGATLTLVDAATEDPSLAGLAVRAMGEIGDPRARFWLETQLRGGDPALRADAAVALSRIGGPALVSLKDAMKSEDRALRETACRALLPVAGLDDITALHEYAAAFPEDDPALVEAVRTAAAMLEEALAARQENDSASPPTPQ
ncbi:MAG TPA: HEAT repeat domain-containing protein [Candidatus Polarisedimenticolaceae bacterium]|nr:HEAT repeat domain-containing protein [Candidatus Polarisedimenticolaceae bacterium]